MALSEIEKLERRYADNPQGLTVAPLAEVHRKSGDVARALELLRAGLALHPDYIPASIVLGRCHLDLGDLPAAEAAFTHVLALDGENVIAIKALADITERLFRFDEAERWLRTLLAIDRSNDEARDQLGRVEAAHRQAESVPADAPADEAPAEESMPPMLGAPDDPLLVWPDSGAPAASATPAADEAVPLDLEELDAIPDPEGRPPEGIELEQPVTLDDPVQPVMGLVGREDQAVDAEAQAAGSDAAAGDFRVEMSEDIVLESNGGGEFQMANAAEELFVGDPVVAAPAAWVAPVAEPPRQPEPELVVTESMAELLLQQGHPSEALTVYRHLESRGGEARYQEKIAELERVTAKPAAEPAAAEPAAAEPAAAEPAVAEPAPAPAYSVLVTKGQSVQAFLRGVLAARPPAAAGGSPGPSEPPRTGAADPAGAPTRPAHDSLSLSSVFGEESTPTLPAVSTPAPGTGGPGQGGVSFDEFFGAGAGGNSTSPRAARTADPKSDDLDQFHAWLQNLKR